jgi:SAM-dependent methyltransferase
MADRIRPPDSDDPRIAYFNRHAATWDTAGPSPVATRERLSDLRPVLGLSSGDDVLEVGCGTGQVTGWLADVVAPGRVTAVDFSPEMINHARARGVDATFRCLDVLVADVGEACFDVVWCMHVFPHFRDHELALRRLARAMQPGGRLIVLHLASWQHINSFHQDLEEPVAEDLLPDPAGWERLVSAADLQIAERIDRDDLFFLALKRGA